MSARGNSNATHHTRQHACVDPEPVMAHRPRRSWLSTILIIIGLFIIGAGISSIYLVGTHPGTTEPSPGAETSGPRMSAYDR